MYICIYIVEQYISGYYYVQITALLKVKNI